MRSFPSLLICLLLRKTARLFKQPHVPSFWTGAPLPSMAPVPFFFAVSLKRTSTVSQMMRGPMAEHWSAQQLAGALPPLNPLANKYIRGHLHVVAGCSRYPGAAALCAAAGQRAGAGYTSVACSPEAVALVRAFRPSLVASSWDDWNWNAVAAAPRHPAAAVVGPGFDGEDDTCCRLALESLTEADTPLLLDGGALRALATPYGLARAQARGRAQRGPLVLTPHGGEAGALARATGIDDASPAETAPALARAFGAIVAVKGPTTFISDGQRLVEVNEGTAALAKAGTGDVLAGIIGALLAQGAEPFAAAVLGCTLHAWAGNSAAASHGLRSVVPEDVIEALPDAFKQLEG